MTDQSIVQKSVPDYGSALRQAIDGGRVISFIGVHDQLSAAVAAQHFNAFFVGGLGLAASQLGLHDVGYLNWEMVLRTVSQLRRNHPRHHILVDIDDGFGGLHCAAEIASRLEQAGASGVVLEDQASPKRCGHIAGKTLVPIERYCETLTQVLERRGRLFVVARTDAMDDVERERRCGAYARLGPDALLMDGIGNIELIARMRQMTDLPFAFNHMNKGKSPNVDVPALTEKGVQVVIYSAPLLFCAQEAMSRTAREIALNRGRLPDGLGLGDLNALLTDVGSPPVGSSKAGAELAVVK